MPLFLDISFGKSVLIQSDSHHVFGPIVGRADLVMKALCPGLWLALEETWPKPSLQYALCRNRLS